MKEMGLSLRTGVDILEISRMEKSLSKERFLHRLFSLSEQEQFREQGCRANFLAGSFCAKEAFSKALGTGIRGFALNEVQVLRNSLGKPYFSLTGKARELAERQGLQFDLSISHSERYAVAFVVAWSVGSPSSNPIIKGGTSHETGGNSRPDEGN